MNLEAEVNDRLKKAMFDKDQAALRGLRAIKSALLLAKTEKGANKEVSEEKELQLIQKLIKQRKDSLAIFKEQGRDDLASKEAEEIIVIEKFLPEQMTATDIEQAVNKVIQDTGANSIKDMGKVMGIISKQLAGKADNKAIAEMARSLLT